MKKTVLAAIIASTVAAPAFAEDSLNPFADEKSGFYLGIGAGKSSYDAYEDIDRSTKESLSNASKLIHNGGDNIQTQYGTKSSNESNLGKIFLGYRVNKYFGVELDYNKFSNADYKYNGSSKYNGIDGELNGKVTSKLKGIGVKAIGFYPLNRSIDLKASVGVMKWKINEKGSTNYSGVLKNEIIQDQFDLPDANGHSENKSGNSLTLGLGVNYNITNNVTFGLQWERIKDVGHKDLAFGETDIDTYTLSAQYNF
ncbi:outer membrane beta-barrel protein [Spartinivicinus ruber]|uniref:outer membrane beta-barrel protein n=1 Tax=Spartinivicinus ruber TaxID=2683272 RepID=UPI0013D0A32C|nr:outer membrane beta-barrel protein [Spartinivicinus ruber]